MRIKTKVVKNHLGDLMKRFKEMDGKEVEVGYFASQGFHSSGLLYAGLYAIQANGAPSVNIPQRPIIYDTFNIYHPPSKNLLIKNMLKHFLSDIHKKKSPISFTQVMKNIGGDYVQKVRAGFGDTSKLASNSEFTQALKASYGVKPNNPLIWTGELRDNLSYSIDGIEVITPA